MKSREKETLSSAQVIDSVVFGSFEGNDLTFALSFPAELSRDADFTARFEDYLSLLEDWPGRRVFCLINPPSACPDEFGHRLHDAVRSLLSTTSSWNDNGYVRAVAAANSEHELIEELNRLRDTEDFDLDYPSVKKTLERFAREYAESVDPRENLDSSPQAVLDDQAEEGRPQDVGSESEEAVKESIRELWARVSHAGHRELLGDFEKQEIQRYHDLIFGGPGKTASVRQFNAWLKRQAAPDAEPIANEDRPFVAHAIQHFRRKLKVELRLVLPQQCEADWPIVTVASVRDGSTQRFKISTADEEQNPLTRPISLPHLKAFRVAKPKSKPAAEI